MKKHSQEFKTAIATAGRQIKNKLIYTNNAKSQIIIDDDNLFEIKCITNGNILQSVMKELDIELNQEIPLKTILTYQLGILVGNEYEYINYGNFVVTEIEKLEESNHYKLICYDKLIYSMVDYSKLDITYPISVKNYLQAICNKLGILFNDTEFANQDKSINKELYLGFGYTFRDVLDEISQVAGGTICINSDDKLEIRYINDTQDVIDEDYLKNINVTFKEKFGAVNTLILTRSAGADKISLSKPANIPDEQKIAIEIKDNQIMNWNDREEYMQAILEKIYNIEYYVNDFDSQGICYYDLCDKYTVKIGENEYPCLLLNDEITITTGISETIFTEKQEDVINDYKKSNKQDIRTNKVSLIVDQQEASITALVTSNNELNQKTAQLRIDVDKLESEIGEIADVTVTADGNGTITVQNINESEPIKIIVKPVGEDFSYLYPSNYLYPSSNTFTKTRKIVFKNTTDNTTREYIIPNNLFYLSANTYDEFVLDYENQECYIIHRVGKNADGTNYALQTENTEYFDYPTINLTEGDYTITLSEPTSYIFARLMTKNLYTSQFTTKVETNSKIEQSSNQILSTVSQSYATKGELNSSVSSIKQTTNSIELQVQQKVGNNEIISTINQSAEAVTINANKVNLSGYVTISSANDTYATNDNLKNNYSSNTQLATKGSTIINGDNITTGTISADRIDTSKINAVTGTIGGWNISDVQLAKTIGTYNFEIRTDRPSDQPALLVYDTSTGNYNFYVRPDGYLYSRNANISGYINATDGNFTGHINATSGSFSGSIYSGYGTIGGWSISQDNLYGYDYNGRTITITPNGVTQKSGSGGQGTRTWFDIITDNASDKNIKNNIKKINNNDYENFFNHLKPVTFKFDKTFDKENYNKTHFGFIAQDILENENNNNLQNLSLVSENGTFLQLDKKEIIALNTWQIQKLKKQVQEQNEIINNLIERIEKLEKESEK